MFSFLFLLIKKITSNRIVLTTPGGQYLLLADGKTQIALQMEPLTLIGLTALQMPDGQTNLLLADGTTYLSIEEDFTSI